MQLKWKRVMYGDEVSENRLESDRFKRLVIDLYLSRKVTTKRIRFARLSGYHWMLGIFVGRCNYLKGIGFEVFTCNVHFGWAAKVHKYDKPVRIDWSGSMIEPKAAFTVRLFGFGIGSHTPKWVQKWMAKRDERKWKKYEEQEEPQNFDDGYKEEDWY